MADPRLEAMFARALEPYEARREAARDKAPKTVPPMVLTVWQPWAWAIVCGSKRIENRPRPTAYRGRVLIHVGHGPRQDWQSYVESSMATWPRGCPRPGVAELREMLGQVIGEVTLVGARPNGDAPRDPWAVPGQVGWNLARPRVYARPFALRGQQGLFRLPTEHLNDLRRAGIKHWRCDDLDVDTDDPHQAVMAFMLAGARFFHTIVKVNGHPLYFGNLVAEAARWSGEEETALRIERETRRRVLEHEAGTCPGTCTNEGCSRGGDWRCS